MARYLILTSIAIAILTSLFLLPVELPYSIEAPGKLVPHREWFLVRGQDGRLISTLLDNVLGTVEAYTVTQVERGDNLTFNLHPAIKAGASVAAGDTIGLIHSNEVERQLAHLHGELATETASLNLYETGKKESIIEEAQQRLIHAEAQAEQQRRQLGRMQALFKKDAISKEELEVEEDALKLYEIQIEIEKAQLSTVKTGARPQQIGWVHSRIAALRAEIGILKKRSEASTFIAPIAGRVARSFSGDTLAVVQDTAGYAIILPVRWRDRNYITLKQRMELKAGGLSDALVGTIEHLSNAAQVVNGEQVFGAIAAVETENGKLAPGLIVRCVIPCSPVSPVEYLRRTFLE